MLSLIRSIMRLIYCLLALSFALPSRSATNPETVHFPSGDGKTKLLGYVFRPVGRGPHPAVVMLHGRAGPYSSLAHGVYNASTLSKRHKFWGEFWSDRGYIAVLVDSFGPRGYWTGFPRNSYEDRPSEVSEQSARPFDAYGALAWLRSRSDVVRDRIGLQGWSNGAMTTLVTMSLRASGIENPSPQTGFRAALAFYPGCGMQAIQGAYSPYAPLQMFVGTADEEVSAKRCQTWETRVKSSGSPIELIAYEGAEHNFDDPSASKQRNQSNAAATHDATRRSEQFFAHHLR